MVRYLGGGGFADVFLYHQRNLDRDVAVKVLLAADSTPETRRRFETEGTVMARLSEEHQNIVPVYDAAICSDGRPYLVMQYCPKDDLSKRYKAAAISVVEVLSIGVQLAGAVESAHGQGILHRDIKPANVLTKRSGRPALTDFGIAVTVAAAEDPTAVGVSIPWSPPELLADEPVGDVRSDVYSLTATLYTLLARRSPFEFPGQSNKPVDLLHRITRLPAPPTGNPDVPRSLERLLARGLAKDPQLRFASAKELAHAVQEVQTELGVAITEFEFLADDPRAALAELPGEQADHTRIRPIVIRAQKDERGGDRPVGSTRLRDHRPGNGFTDGASGAGAAQFALTDRPGTGRLEHTQLRGRPTSGSYLDPQYLSEPVAADTVVPALPVPTAAPASTPRKSHHVAIITGAVAVMVAGALSWIVVSKGAAPPAVDQPDTTVSQEVPLAVVGVVPAPTDLAGQQTPDGVTFTWTNPDPQPGDTFDWSRTDLGADQPVTRVSEPTVTVPAVQKACVEIVIVRDNGSSSASPARECVGQ
jgi:hypothetical protein